MSVTSNKAPPIRADYETPVYIFQAIQNIFGAMDMDVCAKDSKAAKVPDFFSPQDDGLNRLWVGCHCWMNPPYGRDISKWVAKAASEASKDRAAWIEPADVTHNRVTWIEPATVTALLPANSTDSKWWHSYCMRGTKLLFVKGRIHFEIDGVPQSRPDISSVVVHWAPHLIGRIAEIVPEVVDATELRRQHERRS